MGDDRTVNAQDDESLDGYCGANPNAAREVMARRVAQSGYVMALENVAAKARWLRSIEKQHALASYHDNIAEMNRLGDLVTEAKHALDLALQQSTI